MARHDFCALVAAGGAAEIYSLSVEENIEIVRRTIEAAPGRLVMGTVGFNVPMAVAMAKGMEKAGAGALLCMPPYYANAPMDGLIEYYAAIGNATGLPLAVYSRDWAAFSPDSVARLAGRVPTLEIWKDGQGDPRKYQRIMARVGDRLAWLGGIGDDAVAGYYAIGVQGYTSSVSNIAPRLSLALAAAGAKRDFTTLEHLLTRYVHPLFQLRERSRGYEVAVMKKAMELQGQAAGPVRPPLVNVTAEETEIIRGILESWAEFRDPID
jgi:5-dehydro-4-deoxyglucarate dehydratase